MPYTPVELRHVRVGRGLLGYRRDVVEKLLLEVADSFEDVWRERCELQDKVEELEKQTSELRRREELLANALVAAEQAATEVRVQAKREAELIVAEAHQEARSITRGVQGEHARLAAEARRIEALLRAALGMVEGASAGAADEFGAPPAAHLGAWPRRDDTREFPRVRDAEEAESEPEARAG
jgi:cell division initiation protein